MDKRIEIIKSLDLLFCLSDIDYSDEPIIRTKDINELIACIVDQREKHGYNWNESLLLSIEKEDGDTVLMVDVVHLNLFI